MNSFKGTLFGVAVVALSAAGCGSSEHKEDKCSAPVIDGSPAGAMGAARVDGSGLLPEGLPDGYQLQLLLNTGHSSVGVLPPNLFDVANTCGREFSYTIHLVEPGTYQLDYELRAPDSDSTDADFTGTSTNSFTVAGGERIEFTPEF